MTDSNNRTMAVPKRKQAQTFIRIEKGNSIVWLSEGRHEVCLSNLDLYEQRKNIVCDHLSAL